MSIPLRARGIDLANLFVGKVSNFLLTVILFAMASHGMDTIAFGSFAYWWSIGLMVGGVFLGGMSSAAVRTVVLSSSLRPVIRLSMQLIVAVMLTGLFVGVAAVQTGVVAFDQVVLIGVVSAFGIVVMLQSVLFGLLRALEASRSNTIASVVVVLLVPGAAWLFSGSSPGLLRLFGALMAAFTIGTVACIVIAWPILRGLLQQRDAQKEYKGRRIVRDALAFTSINIFSYAAVNVDFTLIKWLGTQDEFALLASGKVYFERFVLPALMVLAGAISLRVLRHTHDESVGAVRIEARPSISFVIFALVIVAAMTFGYWVFAELIRHDVHQLQWVSVIAASVGYLLFSFNAVLFDLYVLRVRIRAALIHVFAFSVLGSTVQWLAFVTFRVPGWALGWLTFNLVVTIFLAFECMHVKVRRNTAPAH